MPISQLDLNKHKELMIDFISIE